MLSGTSPEVVMGSSATKVALLTGSGRQRVGWHVAGALARIGYNLVIHYHTAAAQAAETVRFLQDAGVEAVAFSADLSDEQAVRELIRQTLERFGRIDALVNCAAAWKKKRLEEVTATDVRGFFEVNTLGTFLCSQHAGLAMVRQPEGGCIITMGDWAVERPYVNYAAYFPSKGAIPALTRVLAVELGVRNPRVRVNCILPGPVMLPPDLPEAERQHSIRGTLVKHEGNPSHIAQAVLFLLANEFVTGVCLPVDGGRTIFSPDSAV
jgi:pteridine reductase